MDIKNETPPVQNIVYVCIMCMAAFNLYYPIRIYFRYFPFFSSVPCSHPILFHLLPTPITASVYFLSSLPLFLSSLLFYTLVSSLVLILFLPRSQSFPVPLSDTNKTLVSGKGRGSAHYLIPTPQAVNFRNLFRCFQSFLLWNTGESNFSWNKTRSSWPDLPFLCPLSPSQFSVDPYVKYLPQQLELY